MAPTDIDAAVLSLAFAVAARIVIEEATQQASVLGAGYAISSASVPHAPAIEAQAVVPGAAWLSSYGLEISYEAPRYRRAVVPAPAITIQIMGTDIAHQFDPKGGKPCGAPTPDFTLVLALGDRYRLL